VTGLPTWVLGDGGQARETRDLLERTGSDVRGRALSFAGLVDAAGEDALLEEHGAIVLGLGFPGVRTRVLARFRDAARLELVTLVHPHAEVGARTSLAAGVVVSAGCVVTTDVIVGTGTLLNPRSGIGHGAVLGECVVVNPGANVSGEVTIGDGVLVGSGATILQGLAVGAGATIGAGAVVTHDVQPGVTVVGVPARAVERAAR
jgi:sugar O-acyltransferase (sialic acid O-acetyltransferase NeuD family)